MTMSSTVLFIHPDPGLRVSARVALEKAGHSVREAVDAASIGLTSLLPPVDLIVAPWEQLASVRSSVETNGQLRERHAIAIMVMALARDIKDAIGSLHRGADDCLSIPFEQEELVTRVQAALRRYRAGRTAPRQLIAGPVVLDRVARSLLVASQPVELAPAEFRLMKFFLENQSRAFTRDELIRQVWTRSPGAAARTVDVHIRRLRRALEPFSCDDMIQTVRKYGYRFSVPSTGHARP